MYDDVDIEEKIEYLRDISIDVMTNDGLFEYIQQGLESTGDLEWLQKVIEGLDVKADYYEINEYGEANVVDEEHIEQLFEEHVDEIKENTNFLQDYSDYSENTNTRVK